MSPDGCTVRPAFPPAPDTPRGDRRGLCRAHLLYSAPGPPHSVRHDCRRTLGGVRWRRRLPGPSRPGDGGTADDVNSAPEHTAVPDQARRAATFLPIEVRPPLRHSNGDDHWALAGTRHPSAASGPHATCDSAGLGCGLSRRRHRYLFARETRHGLTWSTRPETGRTAGCTSSTETARLLRYTSRG